MAIRPRVLVWMWCASFAAFAAADTFAAEGRSYPVRPVRIVTGEIGGGTDFAARQIAQGLTVSFGRQVIVENRGGGSAPGETVARALPDGYTLLLHGNAQWLLPFLRSHVAYDPVRDFAPVTTAVNSPS